MLLKDVIEILEAEEIYVENPQAEVLNCCSSDMMSDVLAYVKEEGMMLTGMLNTQVVRTADMMDFVCVCFVRGKKPGKDIIELARERGISLLSTHFRMFTACGRLYNAGMLGRTGER